MVKKNKFVCKSVLTLLTFYVLFVDGCEDAASAATITTPGISSSVSKKGAGTNY